jgi:pimeloyl-ACP methyl ester carboxylesterase
MATIAVNGTTINYVDEGPRDAPALVFAHSMFFDHRMFAAQAAELSTHHRVIRYDLRGQGDSQRHPREALDFDTQTEDARQLIAELALRDVTFVGNSMGGFIGLRLAARHPDLLRSLAHRPAILDELRNITVPLTIVAGTEDHTYPPPKSEQIAERVPHAELVVMKRTGHVHALENPIAVNAVLADHLMALRDRA